jgi:hypothetical protein
VRSYEHFLALEQLIAALNPVSLRREQNVWEVYTLTGSVPSHFTLHGVFERHKYTQRCCDFLIS